MPVISPPSPLSYRCLAGNQSKTVRQIKSKLFFCILFKIAYSGTHAITACPVEPTKAVGLAHCSPTDFGAVSEARKPILVGAAKSV